MTNWSGEFAKWAPSVKVVSYKGNPAQRKFLQADLRTNNFHVVLTTYEYIIKDRIHLSRMKWIYMIIGAFFLSFNQCTFLILRPQTRVTV